jgi:hypothetical protein
LRPLILLLASLSALAQSLPGPEPAPQTLILKLGTQADSAQGRATQGKLLWLPSESLTLFLAGDQSSLEATSQPSVPEGNRTTTTWSLGGDYAFGAFDLGMRFDQAVMSDQLTSRRYTLLPAFDLGAWRLGFEVSTRRTDFDRLTFTGRPIPTPSGTLYVTGYADLYLRDTGYGASLDYNGRVWRPYAAYSHFNYGSFEGSTNVTRIRNAAGAVSPEVFKALSGRLVEFLERLSANRLSRRAALLDETAVAGLELNFRRSRWGLEASRDVDHLSGEAADTYTGTAAWKATRRFTVELQAGAIRTETFGTDRFLGLTLVYRTRTGF